jgi:acyl-coenzyme A thioesterase PaaI-like protein
VTPGGDELVATDAHLRLARALRGLIDATFRADGTDEQRLDAAAVSVDALARRLDAVAVTGPHTARSPLVGRGSPTGPPLRYEKHDGRAVGRGTYTAAYEGPRGYVHGGWIALTFDELLGMVNFDATDPQVTGRLSIRYRRPTPLHVEVVAEAWKDRSDGARAIVRGRLTVDGVVTAEAEGLFVRLGLRRRAEYYGDETGVT